MNNVPFTGSMVDNVAAYETEFVAQAQRAIDAHAATITAELDHIAASCDAVTVARHAIVFSIISPRCHFKKNVAVTPPMVDLIMSGGSRDDIARLLHSHGIGLAPTKSLTLFDASDTIRDMTTVDRSLLLLIRGISMKASAMTVALVDRNAPVYTLDTHMLRGLATIAGYAPNAYTISAAQYRRLEKWCVETLQAHFPDVPTFVTQWALWNEWGFKGEHQCHLPIFGL